MWCLLEFSQGNAYEEKSRVELKRLAMTKLCFWLPTLFFCSWWCYYILYLLIWMWAILIVRSLAYLLVLFHFGPMTYVYYPNRLRLLHPKKTHSAKTDGLRTTDDDVFVCWPSFGMFLLFGFSSICCLHLCFGERDRDRLCSFLFKHIVLFISSSSSAFSTGFS